MSKEITKLRVRVDKRNLKSSEPAAIIVDRRGWGFPSLVHNPERESLVIAKATLRDRFGSNVPIVIERVRVDKETNQVALAKKGKTLREKAYSIHAGSVSRYERRHSKKQKMVDAATNKAKITEQAYYSALRAAEKGRSKSPAPTDSTQADGLGWPGTLATTKIIPFRFGTQAELIGRALKSGFFTSEAGKLKRLFRQDRKYDLDPGENYESSVTKFIEGLNAAPEGSLFSPKRWVHTGLQRLPLVQSGVQVLTLLGKYASPDSWESKWAETKHTLAVAGPDFLLTPVVVGVLGAAIGLAIPTGGLILPVLAAIGIPATAARAIAFAYAQRYTPEVMENKLDRIDARTRLGAYDYYRKLFASTEDQSLVHERKRKAKAFIHEYEKTIRPLDKKVSSTNNNTSRVDQFVAHVTDPRWGEMLNPKKPSFGRSTGKDLVDRMRNKQSESLPESQTDSPEATPLSLDQRVRIAQRTATTHKDWVEATLLYADDVLQQEKSAAQVARGGLFTGFRRGRGKSVASHLVTIVKWQHAKDHALKMQELYKAAQKVV